MAGFKITGAVVVCVSLLMSGCDIDLGSQTFNLQMFGVETAEEGAAGDASPRALNYSVTALSFTGADGAADLDLPLEDPEASYRIAARPQILFTKELSDYAGNSYSGATITFQQAVTGESIAGEPIQFTMATASLTAPPFTLEKGRDLNIIIKVKWKNSVSADGASEPGYELSVRH